jgi:hypothetical protein
VFQSTPGPYQSYGPSSGLPPYGPPPYGPPPGPPPYGSPPAGPPNGSPPMKDGGLAMGSMVLGILALLLSWVPIVNNFAAIVSLVGLGLGIPALIFARRGTHNGMGLAITGLVTSVLAFVLVLVTQWLYVSAIDEVQSSINESIAGSQPSRDEDVAAAPEIVPIGVPAQVGDYEVTVDAVELNGNATVAGANRFNDPPTGQYVITQLTARYVGTTEGMPAWDLIAIFHGTDARQYNDSNCSQVLPDDAMDAPTLNPGGMATFQFCMDVPPAAIEGGQLSVEPTMSFADERVYYAIG